MARSFFFLLAILVLLASAIHAQDKPIVGLIPKAQKPIKFDGKLDRLGRGLRHAGSCRPP